MNSHVYRLWATAFFAIWLALCGEVRAQVPDTVARTSIYGMLPSEPLRVTPAKETSIEKKASLETTEQEQDPLLKRVEQLERRNKANRRMMINAGNHLEKSAQSDKASIVVACIGGAVAGMIYGITIPYGSPTMIHGLAWGSAIATASSITSFVLHCKSIKEKRLAGEEMTLIIYD